MVPFQSADQFGGFAFNGTKKIKSIEFRAVGVPVGSQSTSYRKTWACKKKQKIRNETLLTESTE